METNILSRTAFKMGEIPFEVRLIKMNEDYSVEIVQLSTDPYEAMRTVIAFDYLDEDVAFAEYTRVTADPAAYVV